MNVSHPVDEVSWLKKASVVINCSPFFLSKARHKMDTHSETTQIGATLQGRWWVELRKRRSPALQLSVMTQDCGLVHPENQ